MNLIQNGTQVTPKLKYQLRNCANCSKPESCNTEGEKFKVCARCKIARYCSARCQKKDWPKHKRRCELQSEQTAIVEEMDGIDAGLPVSLPLQAVYPLLLSSVPGISSRTKARAAFRVVTAEIVPISELRIAAKDRTHRMYDQDMQTIVQDFDRQSADQVSSGRALHPNYRGYMVVHSVYFHNGFSAMRFHKNWYFERDSRTDYTQQWRPPTDDWLDFLKETVAAGKGWDRDDIQF
ncbi:hypothetical protein C8R47DRAFT_1203140 [Mycena vitilis]|nr:hypothetical protein C8R47DRAFT_1203140 [Mycena vitilis]